MGEGFFLAAICVLAAVFTFFLTLALTSQPSQQQQIEHNRKLIDPIVIVWKDGTRANCVLYKNSIACPGFER